ncbi:hypothetical protein [Ahrensia sp. R2A130]|uniref:hypothetical protein n=1 Tax=Ahrensia sp. R2A130 TaxID=744979 RepID=UPI0001E0F859|nr:hypothetical protein [Ahrensia sp. R2A130]EFL89936.1 hypothetical protein R2A130_2549 [Ahrensia sp. R2A130]
MEMSNASKSKVFRAVLFTTALAAGFAALPTDHAHALCKSDVIERSSGGLTERFAKRRAVRRWEREVKGLYGKSFAEFGYAKKTSITCQAPDKIYNNLVCTAKGRACDKQR